MGNVVGAVLCAVVFFCCVLRGAVVCTVRCSGVVRR